MNMSGIIGVRPVSLFAGPRRIVVPTGSNPKHESGTDIFRKSLRDQRRGPLRATARVMNSVEPSVESTLSETDEGVRSTVSKGLPNLWPARRRTAETGYRASSLNWFPRTLILLFAEHNRKHCEPVRRARARIQLGRRRVSPPPRRRNIWPPFMPQSPNCSGYRAA